MNLRFFTIASLLVVALLASGQPAVADPIRVTGGALDVNGTSGSVQILGERDFTLRAGVVTTDGVFQPWLQCAFSGCARRMRRQPRRG